MLSFDIELETEKMHFFKFFYSNENIVENTLEKKTKEKSKVIKC